MNAFIGKRSISFLLIGVLIILFLVIVASLIVVNMFPCKGSAEVLLYLNEKELKDIIVFFEESQEEDFYFHKYNGLPILMEDEVSTKIEYLFRLGYDSIRKNGKNFYFSRWTLGKDFGAGIAYISDMTDALQNDYLSNIEPLNKTGWYYYEEK